MSLSESHYKFSFKIEAKPEGGFIARSENPVCSLEGATREEVEGKIRAKIAEIAGPEIADRIPLEKLGQGVVNVNIQKKTTFSFKKPGESQVASASPPQLGSTPAPIEPAGISLATLVKVLIVVGILLMLLVLLRR